MDRALPAPPAPISLESHVLPPIEAGTFVRRRGHGYLRVDAPVTPAGDAANRAERRRAQRADRRRRLPVAGLLAAPVVVLLAGPAAAADDPSTTVATTTVPASTTTTVEPTTTNPEPPPTTAGPTSTPTTVTPTVAPPTTPTTPPTTVPPTVGTAPRSGTTTTAATRSVTTVPATVVTAPSSPSSTTTSSSTTTVPGATEPLPVGDAELPPETADGADPVAATASDTLRLHHDLVAATRATTELEGRQAAVEAEVARLETRVAELTASAFDLAASDRPTGDVEALRAAAVADLDAAAAERAGLALRRAAATTELDALTERYPAARLRLATLVAERAGASAVALDAAWARASDARLDVAFAALAQVGDPYVFASSGPDTFDCSGLTGFAWKAAGVTLDHFTVTQRQQSVDVAEADLQLGDLVFNLDGPNGGHVMLYLGFDKLVVHAPSPGTLVSVSAYRTTTGFGSPLGDDRSLGEPVVLTAPTR